MLAERLWRNTLVLSVGGLALFAMGAGEALRPQESGKKIQDPAAASDSANAFVPLAKRAGPKGLALSALVEDSERVWVVGDSGLVAYSGNDSSFTRLDSPFRAALHCADHSGRSLICAGDSGRVARATIEGVLVAELRDDRTVRALSMDGNDGLLGGDEGLLARSDDGGRSWRVLPAPLPMRFTAVLCTQGAWWAGGAGGRLFRSVDRGAHWVAQSRLPAPVADLAVAGGGRVAALDRNGGVHVSAAESWKRFEPAGEAMPNWVAHTLQPWKNGWALSGDHGQLAVLDTASSTWTLAQVSLPATLTGLCATERGLLSGGAWGSLVAWMPGSGAPRLVHHNLLSRTPDTAAPTPTRDLLAAGGGNETQAREALSDSAVAEVRFADTKGPRYFQNMLDTQTRCSTVPTRMSQLERSYNNGRWVGVAGRAMLCVDVNVAGGMDSAFVLDEWPLGLGIGAQALQMAPSLTFTPGFKGSTMVASRLIVPITFPEVEADFLAWAKGERQAGEVVDSLLGALPRAASSLEPKALVKALDFPRKAKRYVWEGAAAVEYRLDHEGAVVNGRVLWDSDEKYGFGAHALEILPSLAMRPPAGQILAPGDNLRVVQRLNFDRKRYDRARKESQAGYQFAPVLYSQILPDSTRFVPGLDQLEWLVNDFFGKADSTRWPEFDVQVVLRQDGRLHDFHAQPREAESGKLDPATLRSLALEFTWGHALPGAEGKLDTLALRWRPAFFKADSSNVPPGLRGLLHGVVY